MPAITKLLDRITNRRLIDFLEHGDGLLERQFGFRSGRRTTDAVSKIVDRIRNNKQGKRHTLYATLDISNAFNVAPRGKIVDMLRRRSVPGYLVAIIRSFLTDRRIITYGREFKTDSGCPQGSSLGPTLCLLVMETLFDEVRGTEGV